MTTEELAELVGANARPGSICDLAATRLRELEQRLSASAAVVTAAERLARNIKAAWWRYRDGHACCQRRNELARELTLAVQRTAAAEEELRAADQACINAKREMHLQMDRATLAEQRAAKAEGELTRLAEARACPECGEQREHCRNRCPCICIDAPGDVASCEKCAATRLRELERERAHYESCHIAGHTCLRVAHENAAKRLQARAFLAAGWRRLAEKRAANGEDAARKALDAVFAEAFDVDPMPTCATSSVYTMQENLRSFVRMACRQHVDADALTAAVERYRTERARSIAAPNGWAELDAADAAVTTALAAYERKAGG